ncbi:hypothetical protein ABIA35_008123 [Catenulispora sp. MAP12-49]|uniref:hypothetical protein n=1 Tax=Catenulispora sp. MAP12-49 TaxID=3156302 RepID=UPI003518DACB
MYLARSQESRERERDFDRARTAHDSPVIREALGELIHHLPGRRIAVLLRVMPVIVGSVAVIGATAWQIRLRI